MERDKQICGTCKKYDPDICYCPIHGEVYEEDTCDDWEEDDGVLGKRGVKIKQ